MLDFGKHSFHIWTSYGITIAMLLALILFALRRARQARARLAAAEDEANRHG